MGLGWLQSKLLPVQHLRRRLGMQTSRSPMSAKRQSERALRHFELISRAVLIRRRACAHLGRRERGLPPPPPLDRTIGLAKQHSSAQTPNHFQSASATRILHAKKHAQSAPIIFTLQPSRFIETGRPHRELLARKQAHSSRDVPSTAQRGKLHFQRCNTIWSHYGGPE